MLEVKVPSVGESVTEVTLIKILKSEGSFVNMDEAICEFESEKATFELPAEKAGVIHWKADIGQDLKIGDLVALIDTEKEEKTVSAGDKTASAPAEKTQTSTKESIASPSAEKLMRERQLQSDQIEGTGKEGRITKSDVLSAAVATTDIASQDRKTTIPPYHAPKASIPSGARTDRRQKLSRMRRTIAKRLVKVKNETAMLTTFNEVDMTELITLRNRYNEAYQKKYGIKIGFMSLFAKACAQVLMEMPEVNAFIEDDEIIYHDYADIAIAISTPSGLVVPPIKNVESISLHEFELQLKVLAEKARSSSLSLEEMTGGTFTITNGGVFGSLLSTPILNEPQSAILGMHAIKERPIALNGQVVIRPMMYLALSYDHRVIDGSSSVTFLVRVKSLLEDPMSLFLHL
ncbi:MAG TPA: 2-oxoglutarate dehydrogenase complex dihydrolipoyllysine-residue succinyltransferase [Saprospiraceae bacterium]|nr:2-oxoglutarate dehydrogenase complex dihydrolipoyllysine-residue succinyltransferase [Saprospiraceae bacterium]